jgi:CRISPR-associated protein Cas6
MPEVLMNEMIELRFPIQGQLVPVDHGFALYGAITKICPVIHASGNVMLVPIRGRYTGDGLLSLSRKSALAIRLPSEKIPQLLGLAGKTLAVDGHCLKLGPPTILQLKPRSVLYSNLVSTKNGNDEERFKTAIREKLSILGIQGRVTIGRRKTFRIHDKQIVGYSLLVSELTAEESILLQEKGLGGRRKMGCGVFLGVR